MPRWGARFKVLSDGSQGDLLGYSLDTGESFNVSDASSHPATHGLPQCHDLVNQFLSVPVQYKEEIIGQIVPANSLKTTMHVEIVEKIVEFDSIAFKELLC